MKTIYLLKRVAGIFAWTAGGALLLIALLLGYLWWQNNRQVLLPAPTGPYAVGRVGYDWVDETRAESLRNGADTRRELAVWIWYPAAVTPTSQP